MPLLALGHPAIKDSKSWVTLPGLQMVRGHGQEFRSSSFTRNSSGCPPRLRIGFRRDGKGGTEKGRPCLRSQEGLLGEVRALQGHKPPLGRQVLPWRCESSIITMLLGVCPARGMPGARAPRPRRERGRLPWGRGPGTESRRGMSSACRHSAIRGRRVRGTTPCDLSTGVLCDTRRHDRVHCGFSLLVPK